MRSPRTGLERHGTVDGISREIGWLRDRGRAGAAAIAETLRDACRPTVPIQAVRCVLSAPRWRRGRLRGATAGRGRRPASRRVASVDRGGATRIATLSPGRYCSSRAARPSARTRTSSIARISSSTLRPAAMRRRVAAHAGHDEPAGVVARRRAEPRALISRVDRTEAQAEPVERLGVVELIGALGRLSRTTGAGRCRRRRSSSGRTARACSPSAPE